MEDDMKTEHSLRELRELSRIQPENSRQFAKCAPTPVARQCTAWHCVALLCLALHLLSSVRADAAPLRLEWNAPSTNTTGYFVYGAQGTNEFGVVAHLPDRDHTILDLPNHWQTSGTRFFITAHDRLQRQSVPSNIVSNYPPAPPIGLTLTNLGAGFWQLSWENAPEEKATVGYDVWSVAGTNDWTMKQRMQGTANTTYGFVKIRPDGTRYTVTAVNAEGLQSAAAEPVAMPELLPPPPAPILRFRIELYLDLNLRTNGLSR
jgi:hypothetical protein